MSEDDPSGIASRIIPLYDRHAAAWDRLRGKDLGERVWLDRFCAALPVGARILDLGCGSGEPIARHLSERGFRVTGVDSSPAMIALCRNRMPTHAWIVADMRSLALAESFDGILAWDSFFHLPRTDQRAMFGIFAAHAAPGATLMFTSGPGDGEAIGTFEGEPLFHASLATDTYRAFLARHGFEVLAHTIEDPHCGGHTVWLARFSAGSPV